MLNKSNDEAMIGKATGRTTATTTLYGLMRTPTRTLTRDLTTRALARASTKGTMPRPNTTMTQNTTEGLTRTTSRDPVMTGHLDKKGGSTRATRRISVKT